MRGVTAALCALGCPWVPAAFAAELTQEARRTALQESLSLAGRIAPKETEEIKAGWYSMVRRIAVRPGQKVKKGDLIAETETSFFEQQISQLRMQRSLMLPFLEASASDLESAEKELARKRGLVSRKLAPESELAAAESKLIDARNAVANRKRSLAETDSALDELQQRLRSANLHAGIDGVVTQLVVAPEQLRGAFLAEAGTTLARVDKPGRYLLRAAAIDVQACKLSVGQKAAISISGFPQEIPARIVSIVQGNTLKPAGARPAFGASAQPDPGSNGLYTVAFEFAYEKTLLRRDLRGRARVDIGAPRNVLTVPWSAIHTSSAGSAVRVPDPGKGWKLSPVELGAGDRHRVEILGGLAEGQSVAVELW